MVRVKRRIAILVHENEPPRRLDSYAIGACAKTWRDMGHEVIVLRGPRRHVPADLIVVHVDLSVVPDEYIELAARYPVAVNGRVRDIRKSSISKHLLSPGDDWPGPVIVKSDLNCAGNGERYLQSTWRTWGAAVHRRLRRAGLSRAQGMLSSMDYQVFEGLADVPASCFERGDLVVERFFPELEGGLHHVRNYLFLGPHEDWVRLSSELPVVNGTSCRTTQAVEPDEEIRALRVELGFDYGKFDYVIHEGRAVLLDVNKTVGLPPGTPDSAARARRARRAAGIEHFFRDR